MYELSSVVGSETRLERWNKNMTAYISPTTLLGTIVNLGIDLNCIFTDLSSCRDVKVLVRVHGVYSNADFRTPTKAINCHLHRRLA